MWRLECELIHEVLDRHGIAYLARRPQFGGRNDASFSQCTSDCWWRAQRLMPDLWCPKSIAKSKLTDVSVLSLIFANAVN
jgi:hypothetical protein